MSPRSKRPRRGIVFFDGDCGVCSASVRFLLRHDTRSFLEFTPLQGESALELLPERLRTPEALDTFVYRREFAASQGGEDLDTEEESQLFERSAAAFAVFQDLGGWLRALAIGRFLPLFLTDTVYRWIARRRFQIGQKLACRMLTPEESKRFLP